MSYVILTWQVWQLIDSQSIGISFTKLKKRRTTKSKSSKHSKYTYAAYPTARMSASRQMVQLVHSMRRIEPDFNERNDFLFYKLKIAKICFHIPEIP